MRALDMLPSFLRQLEGTAYEVDFGCRGETVTGTVLKIEVEDGFLVIHDRDGVVHGLPVGEATWKFHEDGWVRLTDPKVLKITFTESEP